MIKANMYSFLPADDLDHDLHHHQAKHLAIEMLFGSSP